jgi:hypothetical protein
MGDAMGDAMVIRLALEVNPSSEAEASGST